MRKMKGDNEDGKNDKELTAQENELAVEELENVNGTGFIDDIMYDIEEMKKKGIVDFVKDRAEMDEIRINNSKKIYKAAAEKGMLYILSGEFERNFASENEKTYDEEEIPY